MSIAPRPRRRQPSTPKTAGQRAKQKKAIAPAESPPTRIEQHGLAGRVSKSSWISNQKPRLVLVQRGRLIAELIEFLRLFCGRMPVGFNHPHFDGPEVATRSFTRSESEDCKTRIVLLRPATLKFVATFWSASSVVPPLQRYLFIEGGGALAVENCLKAAMGLESPGRNMGRGVHGRTRHASFGHFQACVSPGRTGYTMSLTNTDPAVRKTDLFWRRFLIGPRVSCPVHRFFTAGKIETHGGIRDTSSEQGRPEARRSAKFHRPTQHRHLRDYHSSRFRARGADNHFRGEMAAKKTMRKDFPRRKTTSLA